MIIHFHMKTAFGWQHVLQREHDSPKWTPPQREWINEILKHGHMCLTVGDTMYSIKKGD